MHFHAVCIISYIGKPKGELGLLLQQKNEAIEGSCNTQEAMRKVFFYIIEK